MLLSAPFTPTQEIKSNKPLSAVGTIRQHAISNSDNLYSDEDKLLLNLAKTSALARQNGVIALQPEFKAEALAESFANKKYLDKNKRAKLLATVRKGQFYDKDDLGLWGEYIYALLPDGRLYVDKVGNGKNHSHIVAGLPVIATGHAYFSNGSLITLTNNSGHYKPLPSQMKQGIQWFLENAGHDFIFEDHSSFKLSSACKGLKYAKASQIMNSAQSDNVTKTLKFAEINSLFAAHFDSLTHHRQVLRKLENEAEGVDSEMTEYGIDTYYSAETDEVECFYINENGKEAITFSQPSVQSEQQNDVEPQYIIYTSLQKNAVRFTGIKNLEIYKSKPGKV